MNKEALAHLDSFTGTAGYYRTHPNLVITDGVKHLCENADCFWITDILSSYQNLCRQQESLRDMQFWTLRPYPQRNAHVVGTIGHMLNALGKIPAPKPEIKTEGGILCYSRLNSEGGTPMAYIVCERDSDDAAIVQDIPFTDFPFDTLPEIKIWVQPTLMPNGKLVMVAYLPSEH